MTENKQYRCVNCGKPHSALYKTYGPSVLKLTKCDKCKGIVDKYIEYDPVIVMIDIVLISKEAQWHVLYNTEFKSYWKLFIILVMVETYGLWRRDSLFNIAVDSFCGMQKDSHNSTFFNTLVPKMLSDNCQAWEQQGHSHHNDLFIMEKDFYVQFISTFTGIVMFMLTMHGMMKLTKTGSPRYEVPWVRAVKGFALANTSALFTLPVLVWGAGSRDSRAAHYLLVFGYSFVVFFNVFTVVYGRCAAGTLLALAAGAALRGLAAFLLTPALRRAAL